MSNKLINFALVLLILFFLGVGVANAQNVRATGGAVYETWRTDEDGDFYICTGIAQARKCGKLKTFIPVGRSVQHIDIRRRVGSSSLDLYVFWY